MPITKAIANYQATKCDSSFTQIYHYIYSNEKDIVKRFSKYYLLDKPDVESMINLKILSIIDKFEGTAEKFRNAVYYAVRLGCIDLARRRDYREKYQTEVMWEDDDGALNEVYEIIEVAPTTEDNDIIEIQKKYDQRQLTAFLLSNTNEQTLTSALAFIKTDSYRQAAKQVGSTDKTVKSRIRSLSKQFDSNQFGNYYDYFTTATVHIG